MKQGRKTPTVLILALEIAAIVVLHAIKINQSEKPPTGKEIGRTTAPVQENTRMTASYTLAALK